MLAMRTTLRAVRPRPVPADPPLPTPLPDPPGQPAPEGPVLPLAEALRAAREQAPDLAVAAERVEQARNNVQRAWAALQPLWTAHGPYPYNSIKNFLNSGPPLFQYTADGHDTKSGTLAFAWNLFNMRAFPALASARQQVDVAQLTETQQRSELLLSVASTYYSGLSLRELMTVSFAQARATHDHARDALARYEAGLVHRSAALRARIDALPAGQAAPRAMLSYAAAKSQLAALLDRPDVAFALAPPQQPPKQIRAPLADLIQT